MCLIHWVLSKENVSTWRTGSEQEMKLDKWDLSNSSWLYTCESICCVVVRWPLLCNLNEMSILEETLKPGFIRDFIFEASKMWFKKSNLPQTALTCPRKGEDYGLTTFNRICTFKGKWRRTFDQLFEHLSSYLAHMGLPNKISSITHTGQYMKMVMGNGYSESSNALQRILHVEAGLVCHFTWDECLLWQRILFWPRTTKTRYNCVQGFALGNISFEPFQRSRILTLQNAWPC